MPPTDPANIRLAAAAAAIFDEQGRLLLHRRSDNGCWALPGGTAETGETITETCLREVREETGYEVEIVRLVGVYSRPEDTTIRYPDGNTRHYVSVLFECRITGGNPAISPESTEMGWFAPENLPEPFHQGHRLRVEDALARQREAFYR